MAAVGIHFNYENERYMSLSYCIIGSLTAFLHFVSMSFNGCKHKTLDNPIDFFFVIIFRVHQHGASLQLYALFLILLRNISFRFAALNRFLR